MNTSPINTWEGAEAYFTFGPGSLGVYVILALAVVLFIGFIVRMIVHENRNFARTGALSAKMSETQASYADSTGSEIAGRHAQSSNSDGRHSEDSAQEHEGILRGAEKS